ncbi:MAG TPA: hypothetical protein VMR06_16280 [Dokdonella sp.]|uniref:hypothetical protein n=1 Tax=Dokdonella sp. TaxID=2291710 RepID=UPI002C1793D0|nr:hypothetical protein [Dokdonella sp.]HUD43547.1 hypothetical protein [Dokdonella sp.]
MSKKNPVEVARSLPVRFVGGDSVAFTMPNSVEVTHIPASLEKEAREQAGRADGIYGSEEQKAKAAWMSELLKEMERIAREVVRSARA